MGGTLITISGLDGAGKSSVISETIMIARKQNVPLTTKWCSYELILLRPFIRLSQLLFLRKTDQYRDFKEYSSSINRLSENKLLSWSYEHFTLIEYIVQIFFKITLPRYLSNQTILCDRYYYDVLVSIAVTLSYSDSEFKKKIIFYSKYFPKPDESFYLYIDENEAFSRKNDIPSVEYLLQRKKYYLILIDLLQIQKLDGGNPVQQTAEYIFNKVMNCGV